MLKESVSDLTLPLDRSVRNLMEARFHCDFEQVRIHTGPAAAALSQLCRARAFTAGEQIFFNSGQYAPHTASGRWLLAHELAHVVQQRTARSIQWSQGSRGDVFEREAGDAASMVSQGCRAAVRRWNSVPRLQCDDHLKLSYPPLRSLSMRPKSPAPPASNRTFPKLTLTPLTFRIPRPGPPSLFLPSQLTLRLPPIIGAAPLTRFTLPTQGTTGFTFSELETMLQRRSNLSFVSTGAPSLHLDPLLFEVLRNPGLLRPDPPRPPLFPMRDVTTADFGADFAFGGGNVSFELWVAMVLQADLYQLRGHGLGLDLFHQPTGQLTFGLPLSPGGTAYVGTNLSATLMNFHIFRNHGTKELFEIGLGQTGLTFQNDILFRNKPAYSLQEAATLEGHLSDSVSLIATAGFNLSIDQNGLDTHPSPFVNVGFVFHGPPLDRKKAGAK